MFFWEFQKLFALGNLLDGGKNKYCLFIEFSNITTKNWAMRGSKVR